MYISSQKKGSNDSLWERFVNGDKSVFGALYAFYHKSLVTFCIGRVQNIELAENIASDTLVKLLQHKNPKEIENFESWLFAVAKNECLTSMSKSARRQKLLDENYKADTKQPPDIEMRLSMENMDHLIHSTLNEADYKIWQLHQQGYDNREIADIIDASEKTVANRKSAARAKLKIAFKKINQLEK